MKLQEYLDKQGLTQEEFAKKVGLHQPLVSNYIKGKRKPTLVIAARIQKATEGKVTFEDFLD